MACGSAGDGAKTEGKNPVMKEKDFLQLCGNRNTMWHTLICHSYFIFQSIKGIYSYISIDCYAFFSN